MLHALKIWPAFFALVQAGHKTAEIRKDDRGFKVGDEIVLQEFDPTTKRYTGQEWRGYITNVVRDFKGLGKGFAVLSIRSMKEYNAMGHEVGSTLRQAIQQRGQDIAVPESQDAFPPFFGTASEDPAMAQNVFPEEPRKVFAPEAAALGLPE